MRIALSVVSPMVRAEWQEVDKLGDASRRRLRQCWYRPHAAMSVRTTR